MWLFSSRHCKTASSWFRALAISNSGEEDTEQDSVPRPKAGGQPTGPGARYAERMQWARTTEQECWVPGLSHMLVCDHRQATLPHLACFLILKLGLPMIPICKDCFEV